MSAREQFGRILREARVKYAAEHADADPLSLIPWEELGSEAREINMRMAEAVAAAAVEEERNRADDMGLGGMNIDLAVCRAVMEAGMDYPASDRVMRAMRKLYRRGAGDGMEIWKRYGDRS